MVCVILYFEVLIWSVYPSHLRIFYYVNLDNTLGVLRRQIFASFISDFDEIDRQNK